MKMNKKHLVTVLAAVALVGLSGCSSMSKQQYTYVLDNDQLTEANSLTRTSKHTGHVVWLNPPTKRVAVNKEQK
ncbi:MAG: hypothetical protein CML20_11830 [Rheinheimera sp.]|uniref:hypothetical protein n=1 Tax=Arsukibacterium sp. UBA3155 TaxID=1946058 RepID=UPI000C94842B|nr:hypothetical protein [Arsukibacterium sp. UBA3155]MAD75458.1 hypothetical protein [Rheinheimera sp.]|tara:strand:+ start:29614 stop:29835 length:222 start_codon:yes stop_codon:yes gene_type:complete